MTRDETILYVGAYLPRLSETFVYREVLELIKNGWTVHTASLHEPDAFDEREATPRRMAEATTVVYGGWGKLLSDAGAEWFARPARSTATLLLAIKDACRERDLAFAKRIVLPGQALAALALARRTRSKNIRHIHAHMAHAPTTIAMYTARQLGVSFSFTGHAADLFRDRALLTRKLKRAAFTACISEWHRVFYQSIASRPEDAYPVVRCGVDLDDFSPEPKTTENNPALILGAGRLVAKKGFDILLEALQRLREKDIPFLCTIAGGGEEMEPLQALCDKLGLSSSVEFAGPKPNHEINAMMKRSDLFVLPCRVAASGDKDGIPVVLMEAMACEVCVVSGDLPTIRELVKERETGFLVPPGDADALAASMETLLKDRVLRQRVAHNGRGWVAEEFASDKNAARLTKAFENVGNRHGGSRNE